MKPLLGREDVNPDMPDNCGGTPLSGAVSNWYGQAENTVKLLLEREGVKPDMLDNDSRTPLSWAGSNWNGVIPYVADKRGRTPVLWAAWRHRDEVAKLLLEREGANSGIVSKDGLTRLSLASWGCCRAVVGQLQARQSAYPSPALPE